MNSSTVIRPSITGYSGLKARHIPAQWQRLGSGNIAIHFAPCKGSIKIMPGFQPSTTDDDMQPKALPLGWDMAGFQPYTTNLYGRVCTGGSVRAGLYGRV